MLKDLIKYALFRLGFRKIVPARYINQVEIKENGEKLVLISDDTDLFFCEILQNKDVYLRESVYYKIKKAAEFLPKGKFFKIYSAYRSIAKQTELWNYNYALMKKKCPDAAEEELIKMTKAVCANPQSGFGGHQTGGAIDIGLCDENGKDLDMGTAYLDTGVKIATNYRDISLAARKNRGVLCKVLFDVGFVNYPNEWWHFCYGDRMWAAYKKKKSCFYGAVQK